MVINVWLQMDRVLQKWRVTHHHPTLPRSLPFSCCCWCASTLQVNPIQERGD